MSESQLQLLLQRVAEHERNAARTVNDTIARPFIASRRPTMLRGGIAHPPTIRGGAADSSGGHRAATVHGDGSPTLHREGAAALDVGLDPGGEVFSARRRQAAAASTLPITVAQLPFAQIDAGGLPFQRGGPFAPREEDDYGEGYYYPSLSGGPSRLPQQLTLTSLTDRMVHMSQRMTAMECAVARVDATLSTRYFEIQRCDAVDGSHLRSTLEPIFQAVGTLQRQLRDVCDVVKDATGLRHHQRGETDSHNGGGDRFESGAGRFTSDGGVVTTSSSSAGGTMTSTTAAHSSGATNGVTSEDYSVPDQAAVGTMFSRHDRREADGPHHTIATATNRQAQRSRGKGGARGGARYVGFVDHHDDAAEAEEGAGDKPQWNAGEPMLLDSGAIDDRIRRLQRLIGELRGAPPPLPATSSSSSSRPTASIMSSSSYYDHDYLGDSSAARANGRGRYAPTTTTTTGTTTMTQTPAASGDETASPRSGGGVDARRWPRARLDNDHDDDEAEMRRGDYPAAWEHRRRAGWDADRHDDDTNRSTGRLTDATASPSQEGSRRDGSRRIWRPDDDGEPHDGRPSHRRAPPQWAYDASSSSPVALVEVSNVTTRSDAAALGTQAASDRGAVSLLTVTTTSAVASP